MVLWLCLWLLSPLVCACGLPSKAWGVGLVRLLSGVAFTVFACGSVVSCHSSATRSAANCTSQARKERSGNNNRIWTEPHILHYTTLIRGLPNPNPRNPRENAEEHRTPRKPSGRVHHPGDGRHHELHPRKLLQLLHL